MTFDWWRRQTLLWKKKSRLQEARRKVLAFIESISPSITINHDRTWAEEWQNHSIYGINVFSSHCLMKWARNSTFISFCTTSTYFQAACSSLFPTIESSGFSTLVQIQLLWQQDLVHDTTTKSQGIHLRVCNVLSRRQEYSDNLLAPIPTFPCERENLKWGRRFSLLIKYKRWEPQAVC